MNDRPTWQQALLCFLGSHDWSAWRAPEVRGMRVLLVRHCERPWCRCVDAEVW